MTAARIDGIDLSHYQAGRLDFHAARLAGVKFVDHKATEGTSYVDPLHDTRRAQVRAAGLVFGSYHFARPAASDGATQARHFLSVAKPKPGDLRPMLDLEDQGRFSPRQLTAWVQAFNDVIVRELGVGCIIYTPFTLTDAFDCPLWVARYSDAMSAPHVPAPWSTYTIWQFSDGAYGHPSTVPGIGRCDINTINSHDPATVVAKLLIPAKGQRDEQPAPKPVEVVQHPVADREYRTAVEAVKTTHGARRQAFARIARIIRPFTTKGTTK